MTVRRSFLTASCALLIGFGFAAAPVTFSPTGAFLAKVDADAAPAKKKAKSKKAPTSKKGKKAATKKSAASGKAKKVAAKGGLSSAPSQSWLVDPDQLAPGTVDTAGSQTTVEQLANYRASLEDGDLETAAVLLRLLTGSDPDRAAINQANDLLGISLDTEDTAVLLELSSTARSEAAASIAAQKSEPDVKGPTTGERVGTAHDVIATASAGSALTCLSAYKLAAARGDAESAAFALTCAGRGRVDEAFVAKTNILLAINAPLPPAQVSFLAGSGQIPLR